MCFAIFDAQGHTRIMMMIMLMAVPFNIALNYMLVFGKFGFPQLGNRLRIREWNHLLAHLHHRDRDHLQGRSDAQIRPVCPLVCSLCESPKEQLAIGVPMGLSVFLRRVFLPWSR